MVKQLEKQKTLSCPSNEEGEVLRDLPLKDELEWTSGDSQWTIKELIS